MKRTVHGFLLAVTCLAPLAFRANAQPARGGAAPAPATTLDTVKYPYYRSLRWRLVGPFRGGRAVAVTGDPSKPQVFYFGAVDGGVWRTTDAGSSWTNITDGKSDIASVGAIAIAPSDPNVIYVGGGESDFREDLTYGDGMYRSTDRGDTWTKIGLEDTHHIAKIVVDPTNPDVVLVASPGHAFGPNAARGIFRSRDGGKTWQKVLFLDDDTGAIDLAMDPTNARILYASFWRFQRFPWGFTSGGGKSGLWKSTDGGDTWTELTNNPGIPDRVGRIGIAVSPSLPRRLYANIESAPEDSAGGIFRSDDAGMTWTRVNGDQKWMVRPWYYNLVTADPANPDKLYALNLNTWRSIDGGHTWQSMRVPHGDDHLLWVDPKDPNRMIEGNDGGATISLDGGATWSTQNNQPTAQFYHVTTDTHWPYRLYGAQQDNSSVMIASRSDRGGIGLRDWDPLPFGESGYLAVNRDTPDISYGTGYFGQIEQFDARSAQTRDVSVALANYDGYAARDIPLRFQWTFPLVFSPHDPKTLYTTAQRVFRSPDAGLTWQAISPDLTRHDSATLGHVGGPITHDETGTEVYATVFAFAESPVTAGVLWAGSDDGLIHVSRDNGATWTNVTTGPLAALRFARISIIEPSHYDPAVAYVAANRYQQDDFAPYLFKTADYGRTWTRINAGIPDGAYTRTIREDPVKRGLLYAGTETGVWFSLDDGAHWRSLQLNLPRSSVRDLAVRGNDLIAATHGRAFWILDDVTPLRQTSDEIRRDAAHLFTPQPAFRWQGGRGGGDTGENPPSGVLVDYYLSSQPKADVRLDFLDAGGQVIRSFTSSGKPADTTTTAAKDSARADSAAKAQHDTSAARGKKKKNEAQDSVAYVASDSLVATRVGLNRFAWNLRYPDVKKMSDLVVDYGTTAGPMVPPGSYTARLTVDGRTLSQPFTVLNDPRVTTSAADIVAQYTLWSQLRDRVDSTVAAAERIEDMEHQLDARVAQTAKQPYAAQVKTAADSLRRRLEGVRDELVEIHAHADEITLHYPVKLYNKLLTLNMQVLDGDAAPTPRLRELLGELAAGVDAQLTQLHAIEGGGVAAFNQLMRELNVPAIMGTTKIVP